MEIQTTMLSSQMPQTSAQGATPDETGSRAPVFGMILDQWAGMGDRGQSLATLQQEAAPNAAGPFPTQAEADARESAAGNGAVNVQGNFMGTEIFGKLCPAGLRGLKTLSGKPGMVQELPVPVNQAAGDRSSETSQAESADNNCVEKPGADSMWVPLLVLGNLFSGGNLPVQSTTPAGMIHPDAGPIVEDGKADSADQPGTPPNPASGDFPPGIAVALQLQNNAWMETGEAQKVNQPDGSRQSTATPAAGDDPAAAILTQICDAMPATATMSGVLPSKKTTPDKAAFTDAQPVSGKPGSEQTAAVKTDEKKAAPAGAKEGNGKLEDIFEKKTGISTHEAGPALPDNGSRVRGAAPGNANKVQAFESAMAGRNGAVNAPENSPQGKAAAIPNASAVNGGIAPEKMEIVIAAEQAEARNEAEVAPSGKLRVGKTTDNVSVATPPPVAVEMRSAGERTPGAGHETRIPSNEQIFNQVREKLDAGGQTSNDGRITLKLHPEELGELKISMQLKDQSLKVEIVTQNPTVKEALMQHIDTLKETLSRQNIAMERFDVSADPRQAFQQGGREERQTAQGNWSINSGLRYSAEAGDDAAPLPSYSWESDDSLINLML